MPIFLNRELQFQLPGMRCLFDAGSTNIQLYDDNMRQIISDGVNVDKMLSKEVDTSKLQGVTITPNGQFFHLDHVVPRILKALPQLVHNLLC